MSAWIVSKNHIAAMVAAAIEGGIYWTAPAVAGSDADRSRRAEIANGAAIGQMLWAENHKSVNCRYGQNVPAPEYVHVAGAEPDSIVLLKSIACYEYQTCEHDEWRDSEAWNFCQALREYAIGKLIAGQAALQRQYDAAPWGID